MKKLPVEQAIGLILGHDIVAIDQSGVKSTAFSRGHIIASADVLRLRDLGKNHIFVQSGDGDDSVHEDDFAQAIIASIGESESITHDLKPVQGRLALYARVDGVLEVDRQRLIDLHLQYEEVALPTLPSHYPVKAGDRVAAFRIIPLFAPRRVLDGALTLLRTPLLRIDTYKVQKAAIVITGTEVYEGRIQDRFFPLLRDKLAAFGVEVVCCTVVPDDRSRIASALRDSYAVAQLVCVTGGTSVDPDDVTIAAVCDSGAVPVRRGVPVQPGNNFTIAYEAERGIPVVTVPAGALSALTTTLDIYLPRLLAGHRISVDELAQAAHGGLCSLCSPCHFPNCTFGGVR